MSKANAPKGQPLPPALRQKLVELIKARGELGAARAVGLSRTTLARSIAGLPCYRGTHAIVIARLTAMVQP